MENLTHAIYMAFAGLVLILAFSVSMYLVNKLNSTAKTVVNKLDDTSYYDTLSLTDWIGNNASNDYKVSRVVGYETIIPSLYRYYKESFAVKILDVDGKLLQYFDTTTEYDVMNAKTTELSASNPALDELTRKRYLALISLYDVSTEPYYMYGAPWQGDINKDAKTRVDMYVKGEKGYIHNNLVDYTGDKRSLRSLKNQNITKFKEIFSQYAYEGDTITDENDELVSVTGSKQISTKIVITYQALPAS